MGVPAFARLLVKKAAESDDVLGLWFCSVFGLKQDGMRAHGALGQTAAGRTAVVGSCCPTCLVDFRSKVLLRHLTHGAALCFEAVHDGLLPPVDPVVIVAAHEQDRLDRPVRKRLGVRDLSGAGGPPSHGR